MGAQSFSCDSVIPTTVPSGETWSVGEFRLCPDGRVGIVRSGPPATAGEKCSLHTRYFWSVVSPVAFTAGGDVYVNPTTQALASAAGAGFVKAGVALFNAAANSVLYFELNP